MVSLFTAYQIMLVFAFVTSLVVGTYTLRYRDRTGARPLVVTFIGVMVWTFANFMSVHYRATPAAVTWSKLWFAGVTLSVFGFILLALEYTGNKEYITPATVAALLIEPVAFNFVVWFDESLLWTVGETGGGTVQGYVIQQGPAFWVHAAYSYVVLGIGVSLIGWFAIQSKYLYQRQSIAILLATLTPWAGNVLYLSDSVPIDLTPIGFTVMGLAMGWAILRADFLEIMPVARDTVVETIQNGMVVIDRDGRIVDINEAGRDIFRVDEGVDVIGRPIEDVLDDSLPVETFLARHAEQTMQTTDVAIGNRYYTVQMSPLYDIRDEFLGTVFLVHDITDQKRRQNELEAKNEQLDQFASVISHDLRNPLNVASGYTELARETAEPDHFDRIEAAHDRMETLIDDLLSLARQGKQIHEREATSLPRIARSAWDAVDTAQAELVADGDVTVQADPERLQQLFENCIRNAVEHGAPDVTVTVGVLEDGNSGFFIEDDGEGIQTDELDSLFQPGFTTAEDGTGFGLAIVRTISEAHGWTVAVESDDGDGTRFEFRGVDSLRNSA